MADLVDLIGNLMLAASSCPEPLAVARYRDAARKFFFDTRAWREEVDLAPYSGTAEYLLIAPSEAELFDLTSVLRNGEPLDKVARNQMRVRVREGVTGTPRWFRFEAGRLYLAPDPGEDISGALSVIAAVRPTRTATALDDARADEFGEIIEDGAIARLLSTPGQPWTDYEGGGVFWKRFSDEINRWQGLAADDGQRGVPRRTKYGGY